MQTSDKNILKLIDHLKQIQVIRFDVDFCKSIGLLKQNLANIRKGINHFTPVHIENICKVYNVNANFIFGIDYQVFRSVSGVQKSAQKQ